MTVITTIQKQISASEQPIGAGNIFFSGLLRIGGFS